MIREHFPYMAGALLFGVLGANDPLLFILTSALILLWMPVVYGMGYESDEEEELQQINKPIKQTVQNKQNKINKNN